MALDTEENIRLLATILQSEASVGNSEERTAVGWTVLNRMARNNRQSVNSVSRAYSTSQSPTATMRILAESLLKGEVTDPTGGATHYYSPKTMPKEGQATTGYDLGGGLELVPPLKDKNYRPSWSASYTQTLVPGVRPHYYKFHRATGNGPVF
jgi:hypothetical protein